MTLRLPTDDSLLERLKAFDLAALAEAYRRREGNRQPQALAELYRRRDRDAGLARRCQQAAAQWLERRGSEMRKPNTTGLRPVGDLIRTYMPELVANDVIEMPKQK